MSERIAIDDLRPGMVIRQITRQNGPVKIRKSGLVSSAAMVQGLAEMGVQEIEIDPEQTVEIANKTHTPTQTQALLRGHHDKRSGFDQSLSEQFNRSLFLPTVQGLPSVWKVYTRQALIVVLLVAGGASIGFTAATAQLWWPGLLTAFTSPAEPAHTPLPQPENAAPTADVAVASDPKPTPEDPVAATSQSESITEPTTVVAQPAVSPAQSSNSEMQATAGQEAEGEIINQPPEVPASVSPELLARFNKAVAALEKEETEAPDEEPDRRVIIHDDTQRVDQLPARLLTRLPSMSFTAHMYASRPRDRWVQVNGKQLGEGDWIDDRVRIVNIEPQQVILSFENEIFSMSALTDW